LLLQCRSLIGSREHGRGQVPGMRVQRHPMPETTAKPIAPKQMIASSVHTDLTIRRNHGRAALSDSIIGPAKESVQAMFFKIRNRRDDCTNFNMNRSWFLSRNCPESIKSIERSIQKQGGGKGGEGEGRKGAQGDVGATIHLFSA
jgi:hypothetical protein